MVSRRYAALSSMIIVALLFTTQAAFATTYTITVATDATSYIAGQTIKVTGSVLPTPGPSTAATIRICLTACKAGNAVVAAVPAGIGASTGEFNYTFVAGGPNWAAGTYAVNATWGAYPPTIFHVTTFAYLVSKTTTTSTTSTSTSTSSSTTSSTSTTSSSITSTSSSSTTSTSSSSTSSSSLPSSSSSSSSGGGGIPEFPFQASFAGVIVVVVVVGYLMARKAATQRPIMPSTR